MNKDGGGLFALPIPADSMFNGNNGPRDLDKQILGRFFVARLRMLLFYLHDNILKSFTEEILGIRITNFSRKSWCDFAAEHGLCIYNWDFTILGPGPDFDIRSLKSDELRRLVVRVNWAPNPHYVGGPDLDIQRWVQPGMYMYISSFMVVT
jgi:hypothetical protein